MTETEFRGAEPDASILREIGTAVLASNFSHASQLADAELKAGRVHPTLYSVRAMGFEREHDDARALADYRRALLLSPKNVVLLNAVGLCLMRVGRLEESIQQFDEAIRCQPAHAASHVRKGTALRTAGDTAAAQLAYERAIKLDPQNADALANMASIAALAGDAKRARDLAERALRIEPGQATATAAIALADTLEGEYARAEVRARSILRIPDVRGRASVLGILADALDGQNRIEEAFASYTAENMELLRTNALRFAGKTSVADLSELILAYLERAPDLSWHGDAERQPREGSPACHVFLLGFFRSGTTLLEQILENHPGVVTLEERDCLEEPAERYLTHNAGLGHLAALSEPTLEVIRDDYWQRVRRAGLATPGKVFIDKHPLNTLKLLLISKLFPDARVIFAIRDPRDVVLSCFRRHFRINAAMYELLTLHGAARSYDSVMRLAAATRDRISNTVLDHRYEDLVQDFETSVRKICTFIGVEFDKSMRDFTSTARASDIRSPSMMQVRRDLYREGIGQWRRYAAQIAPVLPVLNPWIDRFGYSVD